MVQRYLNIPHKYGECDCITLIRNFYKQELSLEHPIPDYPRDITWIKKFTPTYIDEVLSQYSVKVSLTEMRNYDVIAFKSRKTNLIIHFGIYLTPNKLLHIEHEGVSRIDNLSSYWIDYIHGIYRHNELV
jgi:cell wall-associated NlpC family hydrolase